MAVLLPNGRQQYDGLLGLPLVGGKVYTYAAGTNTPLPTFSDAAGTIPNTNPVILDARGEATIFWLGTYKVVLRDALNNLIWTVDNIVAAPIDQTLRADLAANGASLVGYPQPGASGALLTVASIFGLYPLSPKMFGATGDGVTDETTKIQSMINRAGVTGQEIVGDGGTYVCSNLNLTVDNVRISNLRLKKKAGVDGILVNVTANGVRLDGLYCDGTASQPTPNQVNDIIKIVGGSKCVVTRCEINGSRGGGISVYNGADNEITHNRILNVQENSIIVGNVGSDRNFIAFNYCDGTITQNNIYVTASASGAPTTDFIYDNRVIGNVCKNSLDTNIEFSTHTVRSVCSENICTGAPNPAILFRDSLYFTCSDNVVTGDGTNYIDMIAVVPLNEPATYECHGEISGNMIVGKPGRSGIYVGQSLITVTANTLSRYPNGQTPAANGSDLFGIGVNVAADARGCDIIANDISGYQDHVNFNFGAAANLRIYDHRVIGNSFVYAKYCINMFSCVGDKGIVIANNTARAVTTNFLQGVGATIAPTPTYPDAQLRCYNNAFDPKGFTPVGTMYSVDVKPLNGLLTSATSSIALVPEANLATTALGPVADFPEGIVSLHIIGVASAITAGITQSAGGTNKLSGTTDQLDSSGAGGAVGWTIISLAGDWTWQRRGASTGLGPRYAVVNFTAN